MQRHNSRITNILRIKKQMREGITLRYFRTEHKLIKLPMAWLRMTRRSTQKHKKCYEHIFSMLQKHMILMFMTETAIPSCTFPSVCTYVFVFIPWGGSSWMHTSKETLPTYSIPHYFWSTSEFKQNLAWVLYGWKESCMTFFTGKGFHFKKLGLERTGLTT